MTVDAGTFKDTLAQFVSGVTIVTTQHDSTLNGATVSSFTSVSLDPPLILICLQKQIATHDAILASGQFAVNILNERQIDPAMIFAGMQPDITDRFDGQPTITAATGSPILADSLGWLDCRVWQSFDGGDHTIIVGEVLAAGTAESASPLLYHNRQWGTFKRLD
jgi:flavin reductase (DIM6/NTAB) family NADH-FMN oxidoreductase RutF